MPRSHSLAIAVIFGGKVSEDYLRISLKTARLLWAIKPFIVVYKNPLSERTREFKSVLPNPWEMHAMRDFQSLGTMAESMKVSPAAYFD